MKMAGHDRPLQTAFHSIPGITDYRGEGIFLRFVAISQSESSKALEIERVFGDGINR